MSIDTRTDCTQEPSGLVEGVTKFARLEELRSAMQQIKEVLLDALQQVDVLYAIPIKAAAAASAAGHDYSGQSRAVMASLQEPNIDIMVAKANTAVLQLKVAAASMMLL